MVQADDGGLDQGDGKRLEMIRFWIFFGGRAKRICQWVAGSRTSPRLGARWCYVLCWGQQVMGVVMGKCLAWWLHIAGASNHLRGPGKPCASLLPSSGVCGTHRRKPRFLI